MKEVLTPFMSLSPPILPGNIRISLVLFGFQIVQKETSGMKWVDHVTEAWQRNFYDANYF